MKMTNAQGQVFTIEVINDGLVFINGKAYVIGTDKNTMQKAENIDKLNEAKRG